MKTLILLLAFLELPGVAATDIPTERLIALGKLWTEARYFHPYLAYRDIDWDAALVKAIPKVKAAKTGQEYASAIQSMLDELGDPVTRVVRTSPPSAPLQNPEPVHKEGNILVLHF